MIVEPFTEDDWHTFAGCEGSNPYMCHPTAPKSGKTETRFWIVLDGPYAEAWTGDGMCLYFAAGFPDHSTALGAVLEFTGEESLLDAERRVTAWGGRLITLGP